MTIDGVRADAADFTPPPQPTTPDAGSRFEGLLVEAFDAAQGTDGEAGTEPDAAAGVSLPPADVEAARSTIEARGVSPRAAAAEVLSENQVLGVGEIHHPDTTIRQTGVEIIEGARDAGATKLFVESDDQAGIDRYLESGDRSGLGGLDGAILDQADELGMEVIAAEMGSPVDASATAEEPVGDVSVWDLILGRGPSEGPDRNSNAASNIVESLEEDEKAVVWFGSAHIGSTRGNDGRATGNRSIPENLEREGVSVGTMIGLEVGDGGPTGWSSLVAEEVGAFEAPKAIGSEALPDSLTALSGDSEAAMESRTMEGLPEYPLGDYDIVVFPGGASKE